MILGFIELLDETIIKNVEVNIVGDVNSEGAIKQWSGSFIVENSESLYIDSGQMFYGPLTLALEDGRTGKFEWTEIRSANFQSLITVRGVGPPK